MLFSLDVLRAAKGDCLCLHFGTAERPRLILIDGGPAKIYEESLKPRLARIRQGRKLADTKPLPVDLVMVSHIDDDHIVGMLDLFRNLANAKLEQGFVFLKIRSLWHNSFARLLSRTASDVQQATTAAFGVASLSEIPKLDVVDHDIAMVLASVKQGAELEKYAGDLGLANRESNDELIMARESAPPLEIGPLKFTIVGPQQKEIDRLRRKYESWLKSQGKPKAGAALAAYDDDSPYNLSSIVALVEAGSKKILLTGDARGDKIIAGLRQCGLLKDGEQLHVDILKAPHHGSDRNVKKEFFETITADHYVFSGNGEHGNPERATLEMLAEAGGKRKFTVHLTYPIEHIDAERKKHSFSSEKGKTGPTPKWSDADHSLSAFIKQNPEFEAKLRIVPQNGDPHVIDLGDEKLGY